MAGLLLPLDPGADGVDAVVAAAELAEAANFDGVWLGDHLQWITPTLDAPTLLGAIATRTESIGLGTSVLLAPLRHPVPLSKALLTVDQLSRGRLSVGLGIGTTKGGDYRAVGVDPGRRGRLMEDSVKVMRGLLAGDRVIADSEWSVDAQLTPGPFNDRAIPLYVGGHSDAAVDRAGRLADGWIAAFLAPEQVRKKVETLRASASEAGRDPSDLQVLAVVYVCPAPTAQMARGLSEEYFQSFYGISAEVAEPKSAFGTTSAILERLGAYRAAGVEQFIFALPGGLLGRDEVHALAELQGA